MRLEKASPEAIRYACLNFHYAKAIPQISLGYSVFNLKNEWCGVILFGRGANPRIASCFGLAQGQVVELVRMALNGKQETTSKALAMALSAIKKDAPLVKLIVSYADKNQGHAGIIYQATNWFYTGEIAKSETGIIVRGKLRHRRSIGKKYGNSSIAWLRKHVDAVARIAHGETKLKYVFVLDKRLRKRIAGISKPYPAKNAG